MLSPITLTLQIIFIAGGIFHLVFALLHLFFPYLFQWKKDFKPIRPVNRNMTYGLNVIVIFSCFIFGFLNLFYHAELLTTVLGKFLLACMTSYWFLRAILQVILFGFGNNISFTVFMFYLVGVFLSLSPLIIAVKLQF